MEETVCSADTEDCVVQVVVSVMFLQGWCVCVCVCVIKMAAEKHVVVF